MHLYLKSTTSDAHGMQDYTAMVQYCYIISALFKSQRTKP